MASARIGAIETDTITSSHVGDAAPTVRRGVLWGLLLAKTIAGWGVQWDIQWHIRIGRDSFWIAPHVMTYAGVTLVVLLSFGVVGWDSLRARGGRRPLGGAGVRILGLTSSRGFHLAAWGIALTVLAAPIDDLWHRLFGLDVTIWSPPHLLGLLGSIVNTLACFVIATEVYPPASRARLAAVVIAAAQLYGGLHIATEPAFRLAYVHGGLAFHLYSMLAALLFPLALVSAARISGRRWAPVGAMVVVVVTALTGVQIARRGFEILQPVSAIQDEIAKDPTAPIAIANEIAAKNRAVSSRTTNAWPFVALVAPLVMIVVDARRRPVAASAAYGAAFLVVTTLRLSVFPAFAPRVPDLGTTAIALVLTIGAAVLGGAGAAALANALVPGAAGRSLSR